MKKGAFLPLLLGCCILTAVVFINSAGARENSYPPCSRKAIAENFQQLTTSIKHDLERIFAQGSDIPKKIGSLIVNVAKAPVVIAPGQKACRLQSPEPAAIVEIIRLLAARILHHKDLRLENEELRIEKERELQPVCDSFVDVYTMGVSSLGRPYKEIKRDPDRKMRYLRAFERYFKNGVFRVAMKHFSSQEIKITGQEITGDWARVNLLAMGATYSNYVRETTPIILYFKRADNQWKIIDFQVAGLHYTSHNRTTFGQYYNRGFDYLIAFLEGKLSAGK